MRRGHPFLDQLSVEHTSIEQGLSYLGSQLAQWAYLKCAYSANRHHLQGTHFTDPQRDGSESTCQHWGSNSPPLALTEQESDLLEEQATSNMVFPKLKNFDFIVALLQKAW